MSVISIQSHVSVGSVGNRAATFALETLGHEVVAVHTVQFSNHPGHGAFRGEVESAERITALFEGILAHGGADDAEAVISGYLGSLAVGEATLDFVSRARTRSPSLLYLCDPVMGDEGDGTYVSDELVAFFREAAVPAADVVVPNLYELGLLTESPVATLDDAVAAARALLERGPSLVIVTSLPGIGDANRCLCNLLVSRDTCVIVETERIDTPAKGGGDLLAAVWLAHFLDSGDAVDAFDRSVTSAFDVIAEAMIRGTKELPLAAARKHLVRQSPLYRARPVSEI